MTDVADRSSERNPDSPEPSLAVRRFLHTVANFQRRVMGEPELPEPDWPSVLAAEEKAARSSVPPDEPRQHRPPPALPPGMLNRKEASRHVGVSENTFRKMIRDGLMPEPVRYGRRQLWQVAALDKAIAKLAGEGGGEANEWDVVLQ